MEGLTRDSAKYIMPKEVSTITLVVIHWEKMASHLVCLASHTSLSKKVRNNLFVWHWKEKQWWQRTQAFG